MDNETKMFFLQAQAAVASMRAELSATYDLTLAIAAAANVTQLEGKSLIAFMFERHKLHLDKTLEAMTADNPQLEKILRKMITDWTNSRIAGGAN